MAGRSVAAGALLRDLLADETDLTVVLDVRDVVGNVPCVLIGPPVWDDWAGDGSPMFTWRLIAVSKHPLGNLDAWAELDDLVTAIAAVLPIERAEPIAYTPIPGGTAYPAYAVTYSGS